MTALEKQQISDSLGPVLNAHGVYFIDLVIRGHQGRRVFELYIDSDSGVSTDTCAEVSREVGPLIERLNSRRDDYTLVVSSPGLDRPLRFPRQYRKHIGYRLIVKWNDAGESRKAEGILEKVDEAFLLLRTDDEKEIAISFERVVEARVKPRW